MKPVTVRFSKMNSKAPLVVVPARVNGEGPFRFLLDTGASHSCVTPRLVVLLGLKVRGRATALAAGGSMKLELTRLQALEIRAARAEGLIAAVVDVEHVARLVRGIDGVVGNDFLRAFEVTIDYPNGRVTLR